jgi:predicted adenylyl cyclase CyaB
VRPSLNSRARNIELKARVRDLAAARAIAHDIATSYLGTMSQVDTYFHCSHGRLKLREIDGATAELIAYARADDVQAKPSDYRRIDVTACPGIKEALADALGVWKVVRKRREVFLVDNVRIHLDEVDGLGTFLECEAVLSAEHDESSGRAKLDELSRRFAIQPADLIRGSYSDL